ncbi:RNA ligase family protein [Ammoniphilus resinae]|uniref:DNA ligase-1 n=1 Tax=Ammoniphilus resinae TaxID=861532 RepID=A0ABS4GXB6_9BACL|nr:RNA ligase family protein [Ammoniphilus resinae]MBP1934896.1 DNA ligase-1 [Ammoniphilus resinae]
MLNVPIKPILLHKSDIPPAGSEWIHQLKFDGHRCLLSYAQDNGVKLFTRHQNECTRQYPELQTIKLSAANVVLDGEMVVIDAQGKPCFESVMERFQASKETSIRRLSCNLPAAFIAFDILYLNGNGVTHLPLNERLQLLSDIAGPSDYLTVIDSYDDGDALFQAVVKLGLEGIVSKRKDSIYQLDTRSYSWLKIKNYQHEIVEIAGIRKGEFAWSITKGGKYIGTVEFVPPAARQAFHQISKQLIRKEDREWVYLDPLIRCKVRFQCWTKKGFMRSPSFVEFVY